MSALNTYSIIYSLQRFISDVIGVRADWKSDGYVYPDEKPFVTIEVLTDERIIRAKRREAVEVIDHIQVGYHAQNIVDMTNISERLADAFTFRKVPYYDTSESVIDSVGTFDVIVNNIVPMPSDNVNRESEHNRAYIDIEISKIKRRC